MATQKQETEMATACIRLPKDLKDDAQEVFSQMGMTFSTGVSVFLNEVVRSGCIPFVVRGNEKRGEYAVVDLNEAAELQNRR